MRKYLLMIALVTFGCSSNQQQEKQKEQVSLSNNCFVYPRVVDSLQVKDLYDSARWYLYTWHCDKNYLPKSDSSKSVTFGELPLKFNNLALRQDTLEINFDFIDENEPYPILPSMTRDNKQLVTGVGFDIKTKKRIYMGTTRWFTVVHKGGETRYENPLQSEVLAYIKNNWNKLDSCFKELAKRRGINK